jgi:hypothetical protein
VDAEFRDTFIYLSIYLSIYTGTKVLAYWYKSTNIDTRGAAGPVNLDAEFRDTGRAAIIALPHVITHLQVLTLLDLLVQQYKY